MPVHLYGQAADMDALGRIASRHGLAIVEDCCQAHLATAGGVPVGTIGAAGAFSFYPTKNLGGFGDGGAVITNDRSVADRIRRLRNGGQGERYQHLEAGVNSRLDELQAAILRARLPFLGRWTAHRRTLAARYRALLGQAPSVHVPAERDNGHVYHLFVVRSRPAERRTALRQHLAARGIETLVHYPTPISRQPAMAGANPGECPRADAACSDLLSLPLHPGLDESEVASVAAAVSEFRTGS
jgi:dTDP-3-amino-3,4,6-trideoxy-alpha-D-glucose transaminase